MAIYGHPKSRGLTLVEVMVALVLLSVGLFGIVDAHLDSFNAMKQNRAILQADYFLQDTIANLQMAGYSALDNKIHTLAKPPDLSQAFLKDSKFEENPLFAWNANLTKEESNGIQRIKVTVSVVTEVNGRNLERKAVGYVFAQ